jgi:hypothetical protein
MKSIAKLLLAATLCCGLTTQAQTTTNASGGTTTVVNPVPTVQSGLQMIVDAIKSGETNYWGEVHGLYASGLNKKEGGGVGLFWNLSQYVYTGVRVDYVDGDFWMPSGSATVQLPVKIFSWLQVAPLGYAGIGIPLSGATVGGETLGKPARDNNDQPTAILGYGGAVRIANINSKSKWIPSHIDIIVDQETWTGFNGKQYRLAAAGNWTF